MELQNELENISSLSNDRKRQSIFYTHKNSELSDIINNDFSNQSKNEINNRLSKFSNIKKKSIQGTENTYGDSDTSRDTITPNNSGEVKNKKQKGKEKGKGKGKKNSSKSYYKDIRLSINKKEFQGFSTEPYEMSKKRRNRKARFSVPYNPKFKEENDIKGKKHKFSLVQPNIANSLRHFESRKSIHSDLKFNTQTKPLSNLSNQIDSRDKRKSLNESNKKEYNINQTIITTENPKSANKVNKEDHSSLEYSLKTESLDQSKNDSFEEVNEDFNVVAVKSKPNNE